MRAIGLSAAQFMFLQLLWLKYLRDKVKNLEMMLSGLAEQEYTGLYGKSQPTIGCREMERVR